MEYVLLQCVKEKGKLRVKMISSHPFIKGMNCQFPRGIRRESLYYVVRANAVSLKGNFYSAMQKDCVVAMTHDIDEVRRFIDTAVRDNELLVPAKIFGDEEGECVVCLYDEKTQVFSPCGHFITCKECAGMTKVCPLCRANVVCVLDRADIK